MLLLLLWLPLLVRLRLSSSDTNPLHRLALSTWSG
jgi:hypothetical protein